MGGSWGSDCRWVDIARPAWCLVGEAVGVVDWNLVRDVLMRCRGLSRRSARVVLGWGRWTAGLGVV